MGEGGEAPPTRERNTRKKQARTCSSSAQGYTTTAWGKTGARRGPVHRLGVSILSKKEAATCPMERSIGCARGPIWAGDRGAVDNKYVEKGATVSRSKSLPHHNHRLFGQTSKPAPILSCPRRIQKITMVRNEDGITVLPSVIRNCTQINGPIRRQNRNTFRLLSSEHFDT